MNLYFLSLIDKVQRRESCKIGRLPNGKEETLIEGNYSLLISKNGLTRFLITFQYNLTFKGICMSLGQSEDEKIYHIQLPSEPGIFLSSSSFSDGTFNLEMVTFKKERNSTIRTLIYFLS
jgi:hypothetical protein